MRLLLKICNVYHKFIFVTKVEKRLLNSEISCGFEEFTKGFQSHLNLCIYVSFDIYFFFLIFIFDQMSFETFHRQFHFQTWIYYRPSPLRSSFRIGREFGYFFEYKQKNVIILKKNWRSGFNVFPSRSLISNPISGALSPILHYLYICVLYK